MQITEINPEIIEKLIESQIEINKALTFCVIIIGIGLILEILRITIKTILTNKGEKKKINGNIGTSI